MKTLRKILLLEDSIDDATIFMRQLKKSVEFEAVQVCHAETFSEAILLLRVEKFDLIVSDLGLPDAQGVGIVEKIQQLDNRTPIIVITNNSDLSVAEDAIVAGAQDYIVKSEIDSKNISLVIRYSIQRQRVLEKNRELNERLLKQKQMLKKKNKKLLEAVNLANEFVDNVSHEFRTPLTVILDYASILKEEFLGELNEEQHRTVNTIIDRSEDLNNMVNDMLDSSRIKAGIMGFQRERCDIFSTVERIQPGLELKASLREINLEFDFPESLPDVYCDPEKVGRVITNLANNAVKFCGDEGRVRVSCDHVEDSKELVIRIQDNGPGMNQEQQDVIFQRFTQLKQNIETSRQGFGLGLSIVKELVDLNLGELSLESTVGEGTTFSFTIPVYECRGVVQRHLKALSESKSESKSIAVMTASFDENEQEQSREINAFWKYIQKKNDLVLEYEPGRWVLLLELSGSQSKKRINGIESELEKLNRNRPLDPLPGINLESHLVCNPKLETEKIIKEVESILATHKVEFAPHIFIPKENAELCLTGGQ